MNPILIKIQKKSIVERNSMYEKDINTSFDPLSLNKVLIDVSESKSLKSHLESTNYIGYGEDITHSPFYKSLLED